MSWIKRLLGSFRKNKLEDQLNDELQFHIEMRTQEFIADGMTPEEAYRRAARLFGNSLLLKERTRDMDTIGWIETLWQDLRYAFRTLLKNPAFTIIAILSLALGIGANTAIFSLIDALLLRMLPVRDPQQLVELILVETSGRDESFSYPVIHTLQQRTDIFSGLCGFSGATFNAGPRGDAEPTPGAWVSGGYYETLGVLPALGRLLTRDDDEPGATPVATISYGYWEHKFLRDPGVVGKSLLLEGHPVTIVGVSAQGFNGANVGGTADITVPLAALPQLIPSAHYLEAGYTWLRVLARPKLGISNAQIRSQLAVEWPHIATVGVTPQTPPERRRMFLESTLDLVPGGTGYSYLRREFSRPLFTLMALVGLVLLIACANIANLLLARGAARQREIATRLAVGAGRARLIRQLLTESVLLSLCGATLGLVVAYPTGRLLLHLLSNEIVLDLHPDLRVLAFTSIVGVVTGITFGSLPAFRATSIGAGKVLHANSRTSITAGGRMGSALVIFQVAVSLLLLIGAGFFVRTLQNLQQLNPGFRRDGVLVIRLDLRRGGYKEAQFATLYQELLVPLRALPGVKSVSLSSNTPLSGLTWTEDVLVDGQPRPTGVDMNSISPHYFETMRTPLLLGRDLTTGDNATAPKVAIVNEAFVRRNIPDRHPLGKHISIEHSANWQNLEIVGVAGDAVFSSLREPPPPAVYVPYFQDPNPGNSTIEISTGSLAQMVSTIRKEIHTRLPEAPLQIGTLTEQVNATLLQERLLATLASSFGFLALALAAVGLYGLIAYRVVRRTGEMGIRLALGATSGDVLWLVLGNAVRLVAAGVLLGMPTAWAASRLISAMLFGVSGADPITLISAVALLAATAIVASYLPARRASRLDPMVALRYE